ncbi:hypothetical protein [Streptomyces sp. GESEQ-4]|uniref:hypothetical protein n=1 Tax=Streptomyces sp. GESEQ-4 TaxID=2812655 RepID=UPI001B31DB24|nr:hypothetical protein [Streptomyces sp. GESEQ-4]
MPMGTAIDMPSSPSVLFAAGSADGAEVPVVDSPAAVVGSSVGLGLTSFAPGAAGFSSRRGAGCPSSWL